MDDQLPQPPFVRYAGNHRVETSPDANGAMLALYDFCTKRMERPRILVLKLDHRGDFLIGLPALERLRAAFPNAHLTLVCGSWNIATARDLGAADELRAYDFFPEVAETWNGDPVQDIDRFRAVCCDRFDIAIDLRVDEDTRPLLRHVDATLRCGIGTRERFPFLNIALPRETRLQEVHPLEAGSMVFVPGAFISRMPIQTPFFHETDFSVTDMHLVYGPYRRLPLGRLGASFGFQLIAPAYCRSRPVEIAIEVVRDGAADVIAFQRIREVRNRELTTITLDFTNDHPNALFEFRVFVGGHPRRTRLRFLGVSIGITEGKPVQPRLIPSELHVGERLTLLVQLIAERLRPLYAPTLLDRIAGKHDATWYSLPVKPTRYMVIAPFTNAAIKDWPIERYIELVRLLLKDFEGSILLVGSPKQTGQLAEICAGSGGDRRLINLGGQTDWAALAATIREADLVISNDTGVAHLAAAAGCPTLAIYSGAHQPQEWGPRGQNVRAIMAIVACSPCGYGQLELCPHDHLCMKQIEPRMVLQHALAMLQRRDGTEQAGVAELAPVEPALPAESSRR